MALPTAVGLIVKGAAIGLGAAAPIGPINVMIARRTLHHGYAAGVALGAGAVSVDVGYATLTAVSLGRFLNRPAVAGPLTAGSILILSYLGYLCLRGAVRPPAVPKLLATAGTEPVAGGGRLWAGYLTGVAMTAVNPMTLAFWFTVLPGIAGPIAPRLLPLVAVGVFLGTFAWVLGFAGVLARVGRFGRGTWLRVVDGVGGATLVGFAAYTLLRSIGPLL